MGCGSLKTWTCYEQIQIEQAMEEEREKTEGIVPLIDYPIKVALYQHQIKAANMAALLFGFVNPRKKEEGH